MKCRGGVKKENKRKRKEKTHPMQSVGGLLPSWCIGTSTLFGGIAPNTQKNGPPSHKVPLCEGVLQIFTYKTNPPCASNAREGDNYE